MHNRYEFHEKLEMLMDSSNVYFQPPASVQLSYPCVIYTLGTGDMKRADDSVYMYTHSYEVTFIYKRPNIDIVEQVLKTFSMSSIYRVYVSDNLNHYAFKIYY